MTNNTNTEALDLDILAAIDDLEVSVETSLDDLDDIVQAKGEIEVTEMLGIEQEQEQEEAQAAPADVVEDSSLDIDLSDIDQIVAEVEAEAEALQEEAAKAEKPSKKKKSPKTDETHTAKRVSPDAKASVALDAKVGSDADKYKLTDGDSELSPEDLAKHQSELTAMLDALPVKCQKKAVNIINFLNGGQLSCFIDIALKELIKRREMTTADLKATYVNGVYGRPYGQSTANAQTGNIFKTFDALQIADRFGDKMKIREDSLVVKKIEAAMNAA